MGVCSVQLQSCPTLCDTLDYILPGSSLPGILQARILEWVARPPPGDLPDPKIKPASLMSPASAGGFFTTIVTWEAHTGSSGAQLADRLKQWLMSERI